MQAGSSPDYNIYAKLVYSNQVDEVFYIAENETERSGMYSLNKEELN
jgi:hypothetical protein